MTRRSSFLLAVVIGIWSCGDYSSNVGEPDPGKVVNAAKPPPSGWAVSAGGWDWDEGNAIARDGSGNSYVTGTFCWEAYFGSFHLFSNGFCDVFVAKYNSSGVIQWVTIAGGEGVDLAFGIAVDTNGNSYITGKYEVDAQFGSIYLTNNGSDDVFVAKLSPTGSFLWATNAGGTGIDQGTSIALDSSANPYVAGYFNGTASFGSTNLTSSGGDDVFVAKLSSSNGSFLWAQSAGGSGDDQGYGVAVDTS